MAGIDALLKEHRSAIGLTQEELAERAGVSTRTISDVERSLRTTIYRDTARRLAGALGLDDERRREFEDAARGRTAGPSDLGPATGLPPQPTRLIGRERELEVLVIALEDPDVRLLTLTGPGGIGKTRLAIEAAGAVQGGFPGGVGFVSLAATADPELVLPIVAHTLGIGTSHGSIVEAIARRLGDARTLVLLDTFEHLLDAGPAVGALLGACPGLVVLVTSREILRLRAEREVAIPPLELPPETGESSDLERSPAIALFLERARAVTPDLELDHELAAVVTEICRRLNGLPLAIELAAARAKHLPFKALRDQLEHRLRVLTGGARDLPPRQQTMRDTVAWSYDLLSTEEQKLFRMLSVFAGGWTLDAAAAVCVPGRDALAGISALVDKSVVVVSGAGDEHRYRMLDVIHEYGEEQRDAHGETGGIERRHTEYFVALAERAEPELGGADQTMWYRRLGAEVDNMRAALRRSIRSGDRTVALRLSGALWQYWRPHGDFAEGREWLRQALELSGESPMPVVAKALWGAAWLAYHQGEYDNAERLDRLLLALRVDEIIRRNGLTIQGMVALARGFAAEALDPLRECVSICRASGGRWLLATSLLNLGCATMHAGHLEDARAMFEEAHGVYREIGDEHFSARLLAQLGYAALLRGDAQAARSLMSSSLRAFADLGDKSGIAEGLEGLAAIHALEGLGELAARLTGAAETLREPTGSRPMAFDWVMIERYLAEPRASMKQEAWNAAVKEGREASPDAAIRDALEPDTDGGER